MNSKAWSSITKEAFDAAVLVAKFFCALHVTNTYLLTPALVHGPSMLPTFDIAGNLVLADRFSKPVRGDVVLVRSPDMPTKIVTKRIRGMEGDRVTFSVDPTTDKQRTILVPKGHVWIEGDNKDVSNDSRNFGPVPYGLIHARIFWKVWPFEAFGSVKKIMD